MQDNIVPTHGVRILSLPTRKLSLKKCILCLYFLHFTYLNYYIHSLFNYDARIDLLKLKQDVASSH